jgi:hypothetical protein
MIEKVIRVIRRVLIGMGFGSFIYLAFLAFTVQNSSITRHDFVAVMVMSGLIGSYAILFEFEQLTYTILFPLHLLMTYLTVIATDQIAGQFMTHGRPLYFLPLFLVIYLVIWGLMQLLHYRSVTAVNKKLNHEKKN